MGKGISSNVSKRTNWNGVWAPTGPACSKGKQKTQKPLGLALPSGGADSVWAAVSITAWQMTEESAPAAKLLAEAGSKAAASRLKERIANTKTAFQRRLKPLSTDVPHQYPALGARNLMRALLGKSPYFNNRLILRKSLIHINEFSGIQSFDAQAIRGRASRNGRRCRGSSDSCDFCPWHQRILAGPADNAPFNAAHNFSPLPSARGWAGSAQPRSIRRSRIRR